MGRAEKLCLLMGVGTGMKDGYAEYGCECLVGQRSEGAIPLRLLGFLDKCGRDRRVHTWVHTRVVHYGGWMWVERFWGIGMGVNGQ